LKVPPEVFTPRALPFTSDAGETFGCRRFLVPETNACGAEAFHDPGAVVLAAVAKKA
jgi:hypothetical protein